MRMQRSPQTDSLAKFAAHDIDLAFSNVGYVTEIGRREHRAARAENQQKSHYGGDPVPGKKADLTKKVCSAPDSKIGKDCAVPADCDSGPGVGDGRCDPRKITGFTLATTATNVGNKPIPWYFPVVEAKEKACSAPDIMAGTQCANNGACDSPAGSGNGVCDIVANPWVVDNGYQHDPPESDHAHVPRGGATPLLAFCVAPAGSVGNACTKNTDCDSAVGVNDGVCSAVCTAPPAKAGDACVIDADCDTAPGNGTCNPDGRHLKLSFGHPHIQFYIFRRKAGVGEKAKLIGRSDLKHTYVVGPPLVHQSQPKVSDSYNLLHNQDQSFYSPIGEIDLKAGATQFTVASHTHMGSQYSELGIKDWRDHGGARFMGTCSAPEANVDKPCGADADCDTAPGNGVCMGSCSQPAAKVGHPCANNAACDTAPGNGVCKKGKGVCVKAIAPVVVGAACAVNADCGGAAGECLPADAGHMSGGPSACFAAGKFCPGKCTAPPANLNNACSMNHQCDSVRGALDGRCGGTDSCAADADCGGAVGSCNTQGWVRDEAHVDDNIDHLLQAPLDLLHPNADINAGAKWYLAGRYFVVNDGDNNNNYIWREIIPQVAGSCLTFKYNGSGTTAPFDDATNGIPDIEKGVCVTAPSEVAGPICQEDIIETDCIAFDEQWFGGTTCADVYPSDAGPDPGDDKCRFISFAVPASANNGESALRVDMVQMHDVVPLYTGGTTFPFDQLDGEKMWVGPPVQYVESGASGVPFYASRLQCVPDYRDWNTVGLLHVTGPAIVPSSLYDVVNVSAGCQGREDGCLAVSSALQISTTRWGDVVALFNPPSPTVQPDIADVSALVNKFRGAPAAPIKAQGMLAGAPGNPFGDITHDLLSVDFGFSHISACVDAFRGVPYPYRPGHCTGNANKQCFQDDHCTSPPNPVAGPCILCP